MRLLAGAQLPTDDLDVSALEHFLVLRRAGRVAGVVGLEPYPPIAIVRSLVVDPEHRGRGLADALVVAIEQRARRLEVESVYLLTTSARSFFAARGYRVVERDDVPDALRSTAEFASLCPATATCMRKDLDAVAAGDPALG